MTLNINKATDFDTGLQAWPAEGHWSKVWFIIPLITFAIICTVLLSQLTPVGSLLAEKTSSVSGLSDAVVTNLTYPGHGWLMVASIRVPATVEGSYRIRWQGSEFECAVPHQLSNQLLCNIPLLPAWDQTRFDVSHLDSEAIIFQIDCRRTDFGNPSEITNSPELACQTVH